MKVDVVDLNQNRIRLTELWVAVDRDERGAEGFILQLGPDGVLRPIITGHADEVPGIRKLLKQIGGRRGTKRIFIQKFRFHSSEEVE